MNTFQFNLPGLDELSTKLEVLIKRVDELAQKQFHSQWIDNREFCKLLGISSRTAQNYRDKGLVSFSQIGTKIYYQQQDIEHFLQNHKIKAFNLKVA